MVELSVMVPESLFSALHRAPHEAAGEMRLAAAIHWYQQGTLSMERAAEIAGLNRSGFMDELARRKVDVFAVDLGDLAREVRRG